MPKEVEYMTREEFDDDFDQFLAQTSKKAKRPAPIVMNHAIDLWLMYQSVMKRGGHQAVTNVNSWRQVFLDCTEATTYSSNTGYYTRLSYEKTLWDYERQANKSDPQRKNKFKHVPADYDEKALASADVIRMHKELLRSKSGGQLNEQSNASSSRPNTPRSMSPKYSSSDSKRKQQSRSRRGPSVLGRFSSSAYDQSTTDEDNELFFSDDDEAHRVLQQHPAKFSQQLAELETMMNKMQDCDVFIQSLEADQPPIPKFLQQLLATDETDIKSQKKNKLPVDACCVYLNHLQTQLVKLSKRYAECDELAYHFDRRLGAMEMYTGSGTSTRNRKSQEEQEEHLNLDSSYQQQQQQSSAEKDEDGSQINNDLTQPEQEVDEGSLASDEQEEDFNEQDKEDFDLDKSKPQMLSPLALLMSQNQRQVSGSQSVDSQQDQADSWDGDQDNADNNIINDGESQLSVDTAREIAEAAQSVQSMKSSPASPMSSNPFNDKRRRSSGRSRAREQLLASYSTSSAEDDEALSRRSSGGGARRKSRRRLY
ncbi:hypothetical protein MP228_011866 [Amoeboaphelidium protococcarum]|nr:hypothetical protein MP228_011866 [Amoeboaphelidium protococcarum]